MELKPTEGLCPRCGAARPGLYCGQCGERAVRDEDFGLASICSRAAGAIVNWDSRLLRTLRRLVLQPGQLSKDFVLGLRTPTLGPFQIFLLTNLLFFLVLAEIDIFRSPSRYFFVENFSGHHVLERVREVMASRSLSQEEVARLYDERSSILSRGLLLLFIPVLALAGAVLHWRPRHPIGKHIVFATHNFSFVLLSLVPWFILAMTTQGAGGKGFWLGAFMAVATGYYALAWRRYYGGRLWVALLKSVLVVGLLVRVIDFYRIGINLLTLWSL